EEEHAEHDDARGARIEDGRAAHGFKSRGRSSHIRSPWDTSQVAPASGQGRWIIHSGSSASSEMRLNAKRVKSMPHQRNTSANTSTKTLDTRRSSACARAFIGGPRSTTKCVPSRMPTMAPIMIDQMKKKRAISS